MQTILSTEQVKEQERFAFWREIACDVFVQLNVTQLSHKTFSGRMAVGSLENIQISEVTADPHNVIRSKSEIAKSMEDYFLVSLQVDGECYIEQDNREARLQPGDFVLYDSTRPYKLHFNQPFRQIVFQFPRSLLLSRCREAERVTSVRIPGENQPVSAMVSTFIRNVASNYMHLESDTKLRIAENTLDLLATALTTIPGIKVNEVTSMANVQRARVRSFISANLSDPSLSPTIIASSLGISTRYLHKLFEAEEQSVAAYIRERRLEQCSRELKDPKQNHYTITDIAFKWGFNDTSHFSRIFKQRYGISPSHYRNNAINSLLEDSLSHTNDKFYKGSEFK